MSSSDWTRACIMSIADMGWFSSDRTVGEYGQEIWDAFRYGGRRGSRVSRVARVLGKGSDVFIASTIPMSTSSRRILLASIRHAI